MSRGVAYPGIGHIPPHGYTERQDHRQVVTTVTTDGDGVSVWTTAIYPPGTGWPELISGGATLQGWSRWIFKEGDRPAPLFFIISDSEFQSGRAHEMAVEHELEVPRQARRSAWTRIDEDKTLP